MTELLIDLRESARKVMAQSGTPAPEEKTWSLIVELGWLLAAAPEELGGLDLGAQGACALHSELGRALAQAPLVPAVLALDAICHSELALQDKAAWVQRLAGGECATAPLAEPSLAVDRSAAGVLTLGGLAAAVPSADTAGYILVWSADGDCIALVAPGQAGLEIVERPTWDTTRRLFDLQFDALKVADQHVLAQGTAARELVARVRALRDFSLAADAVGGAAALLELTVEHLLARQQFGRPLAMFQALKHRCADLKTQVASAEALLLDGLARVGEQLADPEAQLTGKKAKYLACAVFSRVAEEALQLHGGIGMAAEHPCHLFLKRAMLDEHLGTRPGDYEQDIAGSFLGAGT